MHLGIHRVLSMACMVFAASCRTPSASTRLTCDAQALSDDDYSVISAVLQTVRSKTDKPLVLQAETDASELTRSHWCDVDADAGSAAPSATAPPQHAVAALCQVNQGQGCLSPRFGEAVALVSRERIQTSLREGWAGFRSAFTGATGLVVVSRPVQLFGGDTALIYMSFARGEKGGHGDVYLLKRTAEGWQVAESYLVWIS